MAGMIGAGLLSGHVLPVFGSVAGDEQARADGAVPGRTAPVPAAWLADGSLLGVAMALEVAHGGALLCGGLAVCQTVTGLGPWCMMPGISPAWSWRRPAAWVRHAPMMPRCCPALWARAWIWNRFPAGKAATTCSAPLRQAVRDGAVRLAQLQAMGMHVLASFYMAGSLDHPPAFTPRTRPRRRRWPIRWSAMWKRKGRSCCRMKTGSCRSIPPLARCWCWCVRPCGTRRTCWPMNCVMRGLASVWWWRRMARTRRAPCRLPRRRPRARWCSAARMRTTG
ncbi:hypothetical protein RAA17_06300 [Komagataeibacter rhaeticus]|nr:hypothetical protein [Komagataeibacter rhaeticus]